MPEVTDLNLLAALNGGGAPSTPGFIPGTPKPVAGPTDIQLSKEARDQKLYEMQLREEEEKAQERADKLNKTSNAKSNAAASVRVLLSQLDALEIDAKDNGGFGETGTSGALMRTVPIFANAGKDFAAKLEPIKASNAFTALAKLGEEGVKLTPISNVEIQLAAASIANLDPNQSQPEFLAALNDARSKYRTTLAALEGGENTDGKNAPSQDDNAVPPGVDKSTSLIDPNAPIPPSGPNYQAGPVERYVTDEDRSKTARLQQAFNANANADQMNNLTDRLGIQRIDPNELNNIIRARAKGQQVVIDPYATGEQGLIEKGISFVADSPFGAYGIGAANAITAGGLDEAAGFFGGESAGQRAQFAKDYSRENSPIASMVGEVSGFGALAAIPGVAPALTTVRGGAVVGGLYGALDNNDNRIIGAGMGALAGGLTNKYAPQAINALGNLARPVITRGQNVISALGNRMPGAGARNVARQEVADNANVIAAGQAEGIAVRQVDARPSLRDQYGGAEASQYGGPKIQKAASDDAQAIANRLTEIGGGGTPRRGYNLGSPTQDAVNAEKDALRSNANALYKRVNLQSPDFKAPVGSVVKTIYEKIRSVRSTAGAMGDKQISFLEKMSGSLQRTGLSVDSIKAQRAAVRDQMKADNLSFTKSETDLLDVLNSASIELEKQMRRSGNVAATETLKRANAEWTIYSEFKRDVVKTMVGTQNQKVSPEKAANRLLDMVKPGGNSDRFAKVYKLLPDDEKASFKALIAENAGNNARGDFSLAILTKNLAEKNINYKALREVFEPKEFQSLMNLRTLADAKDKAMRGKNFSNTARAANNSPAGFRGFVRGALGFAAGDAVGAAAAVAGPTLAEKIGTKRAVDMLLDTDFSKWLVNMPSTSSPRAIDAYLARLDRIKAPAVASNVVIFKDYLRQAATQSPGKLAAEDELDTGPIPPQ